MAPRSSRRLMRGRSPTVHFAAAWSRPRGGWRSSMLGPGWRAWSRRSRWRSAPTTALWKPVLHADRLPARQSIGGDVDENLDDRIPSDLGAVRRQFVKRVVGTAAFAAPFVASFD